MTDDIATKIYKYIDRFIACDDNSKVKASLWVLHDHLIAAFPISPFLFIKSAQPKSGKSNLLTLLELLCPNPRSYVQPSPSSIYTVITADRKHKRTPTLLLDEMDRVYGKRETEEMTGILNANCKRGATIPRTIFKDGERDIEELETFSGTVLAGIDRGNLYPDTIESRSITIDIPRRNRRNPREKKEPFRVRNYEKDGLALRTEIADWAKDRVEVAKTIIPEMPLGVEDRDADNYEPIFVAARLVDMGDVTAVTHVTNVTQLRRGIWETRAVDAALSDMSKEDYTTDLEDGPALIRDIVISIIEGEKYDFNNNTKVPTTYIIDYLTHMPEAPWSYMSETKRPITDRQIASILRRHGVKRPNKQGTVRIDGVPVKGYDLVFFKEAIERYCPDIELPKVPLSNSVTTVTPVTRVTPYF